MPASNIRSTSSRCAASRHYPVLENMSDDDTQKEHNVRRRSSKKPRSRREGSSSHEKKTVEGDESCNAKNEKKSRKSSRRTPEMSRKMVREDSMTSSCDSMSGLSVSSQLTASSTLSRSRRSATSLTNRIEMASIVDSIRAQRDEVKTIAQSSAEAIKMKLDADFEEQRQAILLKWKAMDNERKSRTCIKVQPYALHA
ncbi:hypothetical protein MHU86_21568 [Fragilaria crotonensis]|nr:hypothetical protein MHU86_23371 [Fragilaria crotonensis]KAI2492972.1 hypothetical protein MHU86_21568 [Fragilaria crotonensis]